jgi:ADP-ribosylglycohydrolase
MIDTAPLHVLYRAPLTGAAIGDALGMPFETLHPCALPLREWVARSPLGPLYATPSNLVGHPFKAGQFTDDTQMSMALAEHLVEDGSYDPRKAAARYLAWYKSGEARGIGGSVKKAMESLAAGVGWTASAVPDSWGNGAAMRSGVIGAYYHRGREKLGSVAGWARVDARITHGSEEAIEGAAAMALAVSHLVSGGDLPSLVDVVLDKLEKTRVYFALEDLKPVALAPASSAAKESAWSGWRSGARLFFTERGPSSKVWESVPAAFASLLSTSTFMGAVERAISLGGDTDTIGSMTGAMAGAFYGLRGIPEEAIQGLERSSDIRALELKLLG